MKNKSFFWVGFFLSPLVLGLGWLLLNKPKPVLVTQEPRKSLISVDFIPAKSKEAVPDKEFLMLPSDPSQATLKKKLPDFEGKPVIVHFWATWCEACVEELPDLDKFYQTYKDNFHFVIISADEITGKAVRDFYAEKKIKDFSLYIDEKGTLARALKVTALPTSIFISKEGKEQGRIIGPVEWAGEAGKILNEHLSKPR